MEIIFDVGMKVMVRDFRDNIKKWKGSKGMSDSKGKYLVEVEGKTIKRHIHQMMKCNLWVVFVEFETIVNAVFLSIVLCMLII